MTAVRMIRFALAWPSIVARPMDLYRYHAGANTILTLGVLGGFAAIGLGLSPVIGFLSLAGPAFVVAVLIDASRIA